MDYTLYYAPGTASMVVHLALLEIGVPYRLERVDIERKAHHTPSYLAMNPHGQVPTLLVDGQPIVESGALLLLLAERHPDAQLAPKVGDAKRDAFLQWVFYLSATLGPTFRLWFYPEDLGAPEHSPDVRAALVRKIERIWDRLDGHLQLAGPYLLGDTFSGADLMLTMYMRWSRNMPRPATEWPALRVLADRVRRRPSWTKLYELERLSEWKLADD